MRSSQNQVRENTQSKPQFWNTIPDPTEIEKGRREAVRTAHAATNDNTGGAAQQST